MTRYPAPRVVVISIADVRGMTVLELARGAARAGVSQAEIPRLMGALANQSGTPAEVLEGSLLLYAFALELERRLDPEITWEAAQRWAVKLDVSATEDPIAEAEAHAIAQTSIATGLPPSEAGELTLAEYEAFGAVRGEQRAAVEAATARARRRGRRR